MSTVPPPTPDMMTACRAIVLYHTCGCKSDNNLTYFCNKPDCQHEASTLVVANLPFACGSKQGRSEACKIEDKAKKEFVREVDTADKLENIVVLPECTKDDITALVTPWTGPLTPEGEFYSHYRRRHDVKSADSPSQEAPPSSLDIATKEVNLEEVEQASREYSEANDEAHHSDGDMKVGSSLQDEQGEDSNIRKDCNVETELFTVGDEENEIEFVDVELDDDYDIYEDVDINKNLESYGEYEGKTSIERNLRIDSQKNIGHTPYGNLDCAEVSNDMAEHVNKIHGTAREEHHNAFSPVQDRFDGMGMTDDMIDFLIETRERGVNGPERQKTALGMLWSCFSLYTRK
ncbi:uncharacterized protein F4807DRAFT_245648 [Annulohypoxylon truncatum]|uniref:uncharacterized protein n=1 Tax=Annulohypoxylon truncatum TaxID=327061 RepID=UPI002008D2C3|nr:uncharacterized protein F4807DRAFT_245648 [Annulohypoxylon truncatum]KAI1206104.1 hypothetical protein F4807DRAFT_245648 [Annulohypoxylon truncatum]